MLDRAARLSRRRRVGIVRLPRRRLQVRQLGALLPAPRPRVRRAEHPAARRRRVFKALTVVEAIRRKVRAVALADHLGQVVDPLRVGRRRRQRREAVAELQYDWYETNIQMVGATGVWGDAKRASSRFAKKFAEKLSE